MGGFASVTVEATRSSFEPDSGTFYIRTFLYAFPSAHIYLGCSLNKVALECQAVLSWKETNPKYYSDFYR